MDVDELINVLDKIVITEEHPIKLMDEDLLTESNIDKFMLIIRNRINNITLVSDTDIIREYGYIKRNKKMPPIEFGANITLYDDTISICHLLSSAGYNINIPLEFPEFVYLPIHRKYKRYAKIAVGRCTLSAFIVLIHEFYINTQINTMCLDFADDPDDDDTLLYYTMLREYVKHGKSVNFVDMLDHHLYLHTLTQHGILYLVE